MGEIVGLGFLKDESVIGVYKSGDYVRIWPYQRRYKNEKFLNIHDEILAAKIYDKGIILVTVNYKFWDIQGFMKGTRKERPISPDELNRGKYELDEKAA